MTSHALEEQLGYVEHHGDISENAFRDLSRAPRVAWDIETSGLDWNSDRLALCQLHAAGQPTALVRLSKQIPRRLAALLANNDVLKVFHHAMFDLRFMSYGWSVSPRNVACTKVAAKILLPRQPDEHRLQSLLTRFLGVSIDKSQQLSNWTASSFSAGQISYAIRDVIYLSALLDVLLEQLHNAGKRRLAQRCFEHLPTRVDLDILGFEDVFTY